MSEEEQSDVLPPVVLRANGRVGLYLHYDEAGAQELHDCLVADEVEFAMNPSEATHLAQPGKAVFVFGQRHPRVVAGWLEQVGEQVVIDPDVVITEDLYHPPVRQLLTLGEVRFEEKRDYVALGLSLNDVPALIRMAGDYQLHGGPQDSPVVWAPIHAWRALAQLRAAEAVAPLVELFPLADDWNDWVSDDLPKALARFGTMAIEPVSAFLADATRGDWARTAAAKTLDQIGEQHPESRLEVIGRLRAQLEQFATQSETLNAMLVAELWDLKAVEAMPAIERAYASGRVDESVNGDVEDVQIHFGLKTEREPPPKPNRLTELGNKLRAQWKATGIPLPDADGSFPEPLTAEDRLLEPDAEPPAISTPYIASPKVGRNDPCPCGSGKKYKKCCGA